jgi:hypothetical protein
MLEFMPMIYAEKLRLIELVVNKISKATHRKYGLSSDTIVIGLFISF